MEIVSNLAFPNGMYIPWERLLKVCLIILLSGMLYLGVQNHMKSMEEEPQGEIAGSAEIMSEKGFLKTAPVDIRKDAEKITGVFPEENTGSLEVLPVSFAENGTSGIKTAEEKRTPEDFRNDIMNPAEDYKAGQFEAAAPIIEGTEITAEDSKAGKSETAAPIIGEAEMTVTDSEIGTGAEMTVTDSEIGTGAEMTVTDSEIGTGAEAPGIPNAGESDITVEDPGCSDGETVTGSTDVTEAETGPDIQETTVLSGFVLDAEGYIIGTESSVDVTDGILVFPMDSGCVGIREGAFSGLGEYVYELFIPANISDIEPGVFAEFTSLLYVEVEEGNPCYYSMDGILYSVTDGEI